MAPPMGAELGTMPQFLAGRQPDPGGQAWELAGQLKKVGMSASQR